MGKQSYTVGQAIEYAGYPGTITEVCTGKLAGMYVIRLRAGSACVSGSELIEGAAKCLAAREG